MKFKICVLILAAVSAVSCAKEKKLTKSPAQKSDDGPANSRFFNGWECVGFAGDCLYTDVIVTPEIQDDVGDFDDLVGASSSMVASYFNGEDWESFLSHLNSNDWSHVLTKLQNGNCVITRTANVNATFYQVRLEGDQENHIHTIPIVEE